jgi:hypothetical protein
MHRLLLATFLMVSALQADTFTFSSCNSGTMTISPCGTYPTGGGFQDAGAGAAASDNSVIFGNGLYPSLPAITGGRAMSTGAQAYAYNPGSATADAKAFGTFDSAGPPRPGFIQFDLTLDHFHGGETTAVLTDGVHTYSYAFDASPGGSTPPFPGTCSIESCSWNAKVPFDLGADFQVTIESGAGATPPVPTGYPPINVDHGASDGTLVFTLLEANGKYPVPFFAVPEPSEWELLLVGLGACGWLAHRRTIRADSKR